MCYLHAWPLGLGMCTCTWPLLQQEVFDLRARKKLTRTFSPPKWSGSARLYMYYDVALTHTSNWDKYTVATSLVHVGKRYKLASISLLIFVECWAWHLGAASGGLPHICLHYMYPSCFLAGEAYPVHISFYISIASSKSFSRPHFYFPHFSISPFLHFSISPFLHFSISSFLHFFISISSFPFPSFLVLSLPVYETQPDYSFDFITMNGPPLAHFTLSFNHDLIRPW